MTDPSRDEVVSMAREAGAAPEDGVNGFWVAQTEDLQRLIALARAPLVAENERLNVRWDRSVTVNMALQAEVDKTNRALDVALTKGREAFEERDALTVELAAMKSGEPVGMSSGEQKCYCGNHVSLQMVSGGGAPEGYLGKVTLRIGDQYRDYYTHPQPSAVKVVRGMVEALEGVLDAPKDTASQFWSCSGGVYEAHQCSQAITIGQQWLKEQK